MSETFVLARRTRIGDKVLMAMDKEARYWGRHGVPDGTKGVVVGYVRYKDYVSYTSTTLGKTPGVYEGNGAVLVQWENGESGPVNGTDILPDGYEIESRSSDKDYEDAFETMIRIDDLPSTKYYPGATVKLNSTPNTVQLGMVGDCVTISKVDYYALERGEKSYYYCSSPKGFQVYLAEADILDAVDVGNYQRWYTGDMTKPEEVVASLVFKDIQEEVSFFNSIVYFEDAKSPTSGTYKWDETEVIQAACRGDVAVVSISSGLFGIMRFPTAKTIKDIPGNPTLKHRLREKYIQENQQLRLC